PAPHLRCPRMARLPRGRPARWEEGCGGPLHGRAQRGDEGDAQAVREGEGFRIPDPPDGRVAGSMRSPRPEGDPYCSRCSTSSSAARWGPDHVRRTRGTSEENPLEPVTTTRTPSGLTPI